MSAGERLAEDDVKFDDDDVDGDDSDNSDNDGEKSNVVSSISLDATRSKSSIYRSSIPNLLINSVASFISTNLLSFDA